MTEDTAALTTADLPLARHIRRLTVEADRFVQHFGETHGLHRTDMAALVVIMDAAEEGRPLNQGELASELRLSASATTSVLDRLQSLGYVERRRDSRDRRRLVLHVRPAALELGRGLFVPLGEAYSRAWANFDDEQRRTIVRFLEATVNATMDTHSRLTERD
ncbi:MarR family winged helix-turn-helix transcriptional regulator [Saccharomonospora xinjiangensis]|uniref:Transcriptional regulator n=1 Tax=Saccharomonospora xinjiangensis XJ-54 TaxID=882086 RepID=I0V366_9PSEU|nr:MarR family transcriptional regulator [Saccharomonospora xinjiangensis]EID54569.1 transcriptional regulator [Saccharomonospora xinjiangensis XJ-54]